MLECWTDDKTKEDLNDSCLVAVSERWCVLIAMCMRCVCICVSWLFTFHSICRLLVLHLLYLLSASVHLATLVTCPSKRVFLVTMSGEEGWRPQYTYIYLRADMMNFCYNCGLAVITMKEDWKKTYWTTVDRWCFMILK